MLPKNSLGRQMMKKLHVVAGPRAPARGPEARRARRRGAPRMGRAADAGDRAVDQAPAKAKPAAKPEQPRSRRRRRGRGRGAEDYREGEGREAEDDAPRRPQRKKTHREEDDARRRRRPRRRRPRRRPRRSRRRRQRPPRRRPAKTTEAEEGRDQREPRSNRSWLRPPAKLTTGRRKEAVARVRLVPGSGEFTVNGRPIDEYFPTRVHRMVARAPLTLVGREKDFDIVAVDPRRRHRRPGRCGPSRRRTRLDRARPRAPRRSSRPRGS